jgi:hypothetical protein
MKTRKNEMDSPEGKALLTFLERTKEGKYAKIDENSLIYTRIKIQREETYADEEYLYSVR